MGQDVVIRETKTMGDVLVIDTDRSFTGQDGHMITPDSERHGVPGELAERLFSLDSGIDYIFVLQNIVTVRRNGGWDDETAAEVADITHSFLRFYPDADAEGPNGETEGAESPSKETEDAGDEEE
ncbi:MAG: hypothetical protein ACLFRT_06195 [Actinomycetota bacterium]